MSDEKIQFGVVRIGKMALAIELVYFSEVFHAEKEDPLPQSSAMLRGGVKLRGQLIPVLALDAFGTMSIDETLPMLGVILEHDKRLLAFFVDEVVGITTIASRDIQKVQAEGDEGAGYFDSGFHHDSRFASILNVARVMETDGVFTAAKISGQEKGFVKSHRPVMIFEAGETRFCLPAVEIYAAIPKRPIEKTALASGPCLGEISYHGRRIPVICPVQSFGLGAVKENLASEIVALRFPGNLVLGLAVDSIHQIGTIASAQRTPLPLWMKERSFIETVFIQPDGSQLFSLDLVAIHAANDLVQIAQFSEPDAITAAKAPSDKASTATIIHEKDRYLVVEAPHRAIVPLSQVNRIVQYPTDLTYSHQGAEGFEGFFVGADESIALFNMPKCLGRQSSISPDTKVLLTGGAGKQVGFVVDRVLGLELSEWREQSTIGADQTAEPVAAVGQGDTAQVLPILYLDRVLETQIETAARLLTEQQPLQNGGSRHDNWVI